MDLGTSRWYYSLLLQTLIWTGNLPCFSSRWTLPCPFRILILTVVLYPKCREDNQFFYSKLYCETKTKNMLIYMIWKATRQISIIIMKYKTWLRDFAGLHLVMTSKFKLRVFNGLYLWFTYLFNYLLNGSWQLRIESTQHSFWGKYPYHIVPDRKHSGFESAEKLATLSNAPRWLATVLLWRNSQLIA